MVFQIKCCGFGLNLREPETSPETLMVSFIFFILDKILAFSFHEKNLLLSAKTFLIVQN